MAEIKPYPVDPFYGAEQAQIEDKVTDDFSNYDIVKATQYGIFSRCVQLIEQGFDVNTMDFENVSLLHWAAINNRHELVNYYLSKGANIDVIGGELKSTPIHWAVRQGLLDMVSLLLKNGANPNLFDAQGLACIHVACQLSYTHIVAFLLAYGVNVDFKDANGMTPLMWAIARSSGPDPLRLLITWGANVNAQDVNGLTAGHYAAQVGNVVSLKQLNQANIDWSVMNNDGITVYQILLKKNIPWLTNRLDEFMIERGIKRHPIYFVNLTSKNKNFRFMVMLLTPVLTFLCFGLLFHLSLNYWMKLFGFLILVFVVRFGLTTFIDERAQIISMFSLATCTTAYLCLTYFYFFSPLSSNLANIGFVVSITILLYNFIICCKSDPGYIQTNSNDRIDAILSMTSVDPQKRVTLNRFCTTCLIRKPLRSKHCAVCNRCVSKFDHHCPWIYNCVGVNNLSSFIFYLSALIPSLALFIYGAYTFNFHFFFKKIDHQSMGQFLYMFIIDSAFGSPWVFYCTVNAIFYLFWVSVLLVSQTYQVFLVNKTTNERINWSRYAAMSHHHKDVYASEHDADFSYNMGIVKNVQDTFRCKSFKIDWNYIYTVEEFNKIVTPKMKAYEPV